MSIVGFGLLSSTTFASESFVLVGPETQTFSTCRAQITEASPEHLEVLFSVQDQSGDVITLEVIDLTRESSSADMKYLAFEDREFSEMGDDLFVSETRMEFERLFDRRLPTETNVFDTRATWSFRRLRETKKLSGPKDQYSEFEKTIYNCPHLTPSSSW